MKLIAPTEPINIGPTYLQDLMIKELEKPEKSVIFFGGSGGVGKSTGACIWLVLQSIRYPGTVWALCRARLTTLKRSTLISLLNVLKSFNLKDGIHFNHDHQMNTITFWNGSSIMMLDLFLYPSDPDFERLSSIEITGAMIDEVSEISFKAYNVLQSRIRFKHQEYNLTPKLLIVSNPTRNFIKGLIYDPYINKTLPLNYSVILGLAKDNKYIDKSYTENLLRLDPQTKARLLYGDWSYESSDDSLFDPEHLVNCFYNHSFVNQDDRNKYICADIANLGNDSTIISIWSGFECYDIKKYQKLNTPQIVENIKQLMSIHQVPIQNVIVDSVGVGVGVADSLRGCVRFIANSKPKNPVYNSLKDECYFIFSKMINLDEVKITYNSLKDDIVDELSAHKLYKIDSDSSKSRITPKEIVKQSIGRSPDISDSLSLRFYFVNDKPKLQFSFL